MMNQLPSMIPMLFSSQVEQRSPRLKEPPLRVKVAVEVLTNLTHKTMERAAISEHQIQTIDGQKLTTAESNLQATAANLLNEYLLGRLKPDHWEKEKTNTLPVDRPGVVTRCFSCSVNSPRPDCPLCNGTGTCLVYPNQMSDE